MTQLIRVAVPLIVSLASFSITLFTDRTLLLRFDPVAAGAAIAAGNLYWTFACVPVSLVGFATTLVAQKHGRRDADEQTRRLIAGGVWLTALATPFFLVLAIAAPWIFKLLGHDGALAAMETTYFRWMQLVAPAGMLEATLGAYFVGRGRAAPVMWVNLASSAVNIVLDVWLIFGGLGVPPLGVAGAAIATVAAMWLKAAVLAAMLLRQQPAARWAGDWQPRVAIGRAIAVPGSTLGLQQMVRSFLFSSMVVAVGRIGPVALAATAAAMSVYQLLSIPLIGLAGAVTVLAGQASVAQDRNRDVAAVVRSGLLLALGYALMLAAVMTLLPRPILQAVAGKAEDEISRQMVPAAIGLLRLAGVFAVSEATLLIVTAVLKGIGRPFSTLVAAVVATSIGAAGLTMLPGDANLAVRAAWWWLIGWSLLQSAPLAFHLRRRPIVA